jgi:hypothetical protein
MEKIRLFFEHLQQKQILINLRVAGREGYNRLTMITGMRQQKDALQFSIDPPRGFDEAVVGLGRWVLFFQLTGPDKLEYKFTTRGGAFEGPAIWIDFPDHVERVQRRRFFRVETVPGTRLRFALGGQAREMDVINLSIGGALAIFVRRKGESGRLALLKPKDQVRQAQLICPLEGETLNAKIQKLQVIRVEEDRENDRLRYALQFTLADYTAEKDLTSIVYALQRFFLRHR